MSTNKQEAAIHLCLNISAEEGTKTLWTGIEPIVGFKLKRDVQLSIIDEFRTHYPNETGGILIGHYTEDLRIAVVIEARPRASDSKAGPTWFIRGRKGLTQVLRESWQSGEYYLGEWHSHPNGLASPSATDDSQLLNIARAPAYKCPEPILVVAGGPIEDILLRAFIYTSSSSRREFHSIKRTD
jgi:integrative and conjugative element protein (TIGR02256 family)